LETKKLNLGAAIPKRTPQIARPQNSHVVTCPAGDLEKHD